MNDTNTRELEALLYGEEASTEDVFSLDDFKNMTEGYERAQSLKEMSITAGFKTLMVLAEAEAYRCIQAETTYSGIDKNKAEKLRLARICAVHTRDFLRRTIETALDTPRPVLQQNQQ